MAKGGGIMHSIIIYLPHLLAFAGFGVLLGGVAAIQQNCGSVDPANLAQVQSIHYLAPVSCDKLFRYTWWITFFHFFVWLLVLFFLCSRTIHKIRAGLIGLLAAVSVLLMDTANTYLYFNDASWPAGDNGTFKTRARVITAGAIIAAVADLLMLLAIGWHDEKTSYEERTGRKETHTVPTYGGVPPGTTPVATGVTSTTAAAPVSAV